MEQSKTDRLRELAEFIRSRRSRLSPEKAGLPPGGGRRRTPGLRRSEIAALAGMSVDWYTWLEQGRDIQVSAQVLESLARVLQLDESERKHLYLLAIRQQPAQPLSLNANVSQTLQNFLDQLGAAPACVTGKYASRRFWDGRQNQPASQRAVP